MFLLEDVAPHLQVCCGFVGLFVSAAAEFLHRKKEKLTRSNTQRELQRNHFAELAIN